MVNHKEVNGKMIIILPFVLSVLFSCQKDKTKNVIVAISANAEWRVVKSQYPNENYKETPWGEYFEKPIETAKGKEEVIFFHEGWGKVSAAGATQYAIDKWNPKVIINLGTCGGLEGLVDRFDILLVNATIIYDIQEAMGDSKESIREYSTKLDLSWITLPDSVRKTTMVSADRDLIPQEIEMLQANYSAIAGDWETGSIAYVCQQNKVKLLALRGVTDLVGKNGGEAYGNPNVFTNNTEIVMRQLLDDLPQWLNRFELKSK